MVTSHVKVIHRGDYKERELLFVKWFLLPIQLSPETKNVFCTGVENAGCNYVAMCNFPCHTAVNIYIFYSQITGLTVFEF